MNNSAASKVSISHVWFPYLIHHRIFSLKPLEFDPTSLGLYALLVFKQASNKQDLPADHSMALC